MQINYPSLLLRLVKIIKLSSEEVEKLIQTFLTYGQNELSDWLLIALITASVQ